MVTDLPRDLVHLRATPQYVYTGYTPGYLGTVVSMTAPSSTAPATL
ncbi:MAG: hypothetical protein IPH64_03875 [Comamonadaceae bacterium]|nr:hypothetical protein [Comamonadaceae bacterium]